MRIAAALVGSVLAWFVVATIGNLAIRLSWPAYVAVERSMAFSFDMMVARLLLAALCSLCAGAAAAWISRGRRMLVRAVGIVLTLLFLPIHYGLWDRFPVWYHAVFLLSLFPLTLLGGFLFARARRSAA